MSDHSIEARPEHQLHELTISNRISEIIKVEKWIAEFSNQANLSQREAFSLDLVLNEVLINVISYGYDDNEEHTILIRINNFLSEIEVEIIDDARPFNPLEVQPSNIGQTLEEASIGGRGILLMKKYCKQLSYRYSGKQNHLLLTINKEQP